MATTVVQLLLLIPRSCGSRDLNRLVDAVSLGRVDLLSSLGNLLQDGLVGQLGDDLGALVLEGYLVALDACGEKEVLSVLRDE